MNSIRELRRAKLQVEINVMPSQNTEEIVDWVWRFFNYFHQDLEAKVTLMEKLAPSPAKEVLGAHLLDSPVETNGYDLLGETPPDGADLLN